MTPTRPGVAAFVLPVVLAVGFVVASFAVLPRHGPTFDAVLGDYAYGEYLWEFAKSGDDSWLRADRNAADGVTRFEEGRLDFLGRDSHPVWQLTYPLKWVYPIPGMLSAAGCDLLARRLGWLHPIDAHHAVCPLAIALLLFLLFRFVAARAGTMAAFVATLSVALHPHLFGHAQNDIKDAPTLLIVFAALFAYVRVLERESRAALLLGALLTGVGLATKVNAIWPAAFFGVVFLASRGRDLVRDPAFRRRLVPVLLAAPLIAVAAYLICSPQYRVDGWQRFVEHWRYALTESTRVEGRDHFSIEPLSNLFLASPLPLFPLALAGVVIAWRRRLLRRDVLALLLLLGTVPVVRPCFPGMRYFNLIRHFLEVLPVAAIFAGIAVAAALERVRSGANADSIARRVAVPTLALLALFAPQVRALATVIPYETTWFNAVAGGLGGAQARGITDADDYWCQSSREAVRWLNENATPGALVVDPFAPWMIGSLAKTELRPDLTFVKNDEGIRLLVDQGLLRADRDRSKWAVAPIVYVTYVPQSRRFNQKDGPRTAILRHCETNLAPHHVIRSDGGEIVRFYRIETTR